MRLKYFATTLISIFLILSIKAEEGDTLIVQTIDWETPILPGWNSPRSGYYQFPGDTISFSKILMYYTLKCDPGQNPACGEWDYTTHTRIHEHTGILDSNLYYHPNYIVNNISPDSFMYMNDVSYYYEASLEYSNSTEPTNEASISEGGFSLTFNDTDSPSDGKMQFIYSADELIQSNLWEGDLTGLTLSCSTDNLSFKHLEIKIQNTNLNSIQSDSLITSGFKTVFKQNYEFANGINNLSFSFPFNWDGSSNILIELSYSDYTGSGIIEADSVVSDYINQSILTDHFLDFKGWDYLDLPADVFSTIDSSITISFWQYGNPEIQPINSSIFEGVDSLGNRILNAHLPWSNGRIYWDAGWDDGNDRIDRGSGDPGVYEGKWNFWTFTKDTRAGFMRIFLNGQLWFQGSVKYKPMSGIANFRIGAGISYNGYYAGMIDDVRIWDTVVGWDDIKEWMYKSIDNTHPNYDHLRAYYQLNDASGTTVEDKSPNGFTAEQFGFPEWKDYRGSARFKNGMSTFIRPHISLQNGEYNASLLDSIVVVDTFSHAPISIVFFDPNDPPTPTDTLTKYPSYYNNYVYDENAQAIDSTLVVPDGIIYLENMPYYGEPYEEVIPWEIGRFITPYGNNLSLGQGFTWVYDVTDYEPFLRDTVHITAGNFQELLDLKFYMIEGTPPREVKKIEKVNSGYFYLNNFEEAVPPVSIPKIAGAHTFRVKTRTSGHLFDNATNCAEFCPKIHDLKVDGITAYEWQILQECSDNPLYPQGGTWIYDRAGWCPGAKVMEQDIEITPYINGDTMELDYNSQTDPFGAYSLEVQLFSYGEPNFILDAAVDEIIAPNQLKRYGRFNPTASSPIIVIQNMGKDTLHSLTINYGPVGQNKSFEWSGNLAYMEKEEVTLEAFEWEEWLGGDGIFNVSLSDPNGQTDENPINNLYESQYQLPEVLPSTFIIKFKTNLMASQNEYEILTNSGIQMFEKTNFEPSTLYVDTITLLNGCYDFYLYDSGDNGIAFWANDEGSGSLKFYNLDGDRIKQFNGDFGDRIYYSFYADLYLNTDNNLENNLNFKIIPNPTNGQFNLSYALTETGPLSIRVISSAGKTVWQNIFDGEKSGNILINLDNIPSGMYTVQLKYGEYIEHKKLIIN